MSTDFSTVELRRARRPRLRREWQIFEIAGLEDHDPISADKSWDLGGVIVSCVSTPPVLAKRARPDEVHAPVDHWVLSCCRRGVVSLKTASHLLKVPPGVPFLWSPDEGQTGDRPPVETIQIVVPRDLFQDEAAMLDAHRDTVVDTPLGLVLGKFMMELERWLPSLRADDLPHLGVAVRSMIAACLAPSADRTDFAIDRMAWSKAERLRQVVRAHLRSPSLGPDLLCRMVGISRSSLYRLFEQSGGVAHYIQRERLLLAHAILSDPQSRQSILGISEDLCFADASSFSRAFRHEFGCSPSEVRFASAKSKRVTTLSRRSPA